jgi:putative intracellular protease/amidase
VFLCGGPGFAEFRAGGAHAAEADRLIAEAVAAGRTVAAFGTAPAVLADGGWLRGRQATCFVWSQPARLYVDALERGGATFVDEPAVVDGPFVTGRDPADATAFARQLISQLGPP